MDRKAGDLSAENASPVVGDGPGGAGEEALVRVVERHVIPRLAALQRPHLIRADRFGDGLTERVDALADLALTSDDERSMSLVHDLHREGRSFSQLQLGLIAPAARRLNDLWTSDRATFVDVTLAAGSLKRLMRFIALDLVPAHARPLRDKIMLIAPAPGDDHNLGAAMAAEYFRRDGWTVRHEPAGTTETIVQIVGAEWFDVVGFSLTTRDRANALAEAIRLVRSSALNPRVLVIASGEAILKHPDLVPAVGADAMVMPLPGAPRRTMRLVAGLFGVEG